jgi:hypothetical protein
MIQKRALRIIFPWVPYDEALSVAGLQQLSTRRQRFTDKLFHEIESNDSHRLHNLLPPRNLKHFSLRKNTNLMLTSRENDIGKLLLYIIH